MEERNTQTPEATGGERMFTQDEVNRIVSERLAREREKPKEDDRETALNEREKALEARENRFACMEYLKSLKVDDKRQSALMEVLDTTNVEKFKAQAEKLINGFQVGSAYTPPANSSSSIDGRLREAFRLK